MNAEKRRQEILNILQKEQNPITASVLGERLGVSRQVIVGDVGMLRAAGYDIISLVRGYIIKKHQKYTKVFKVLHSDDDVKTELNLIVDLGGNVEDVFVFHRVYGKLTAPMDIKSRADVDKFLSEIASGKSSLLKNVTSGYHYHTVCATSKEILENIEKELKSRGFLAPLKSFEPIGIDTNTY